MIKKKNAKYIFVDRDIYFMNVNYDKYWGG